MNTPSDSALAQAFNEYVGERFGCIMPIQDAAFAIRRRAHEIYASRGSADELEYCRAQMKAVWDYLSPNASNDMDWADEIIIAIDQRSQPAAAGELPEAVGGFVVANGQGTAWRKWGQVGPEWTTDIDDALTFARRRDAESFSAEDEDAWLIQQVGALGITINGRTATHYCSICGALWAAYPDHWSLVSLYCDKCCDNAAMREQIVRIAIAAVAECITPAELWQVIDGNPGITPDKQIALAAARACAEAADDDTAVAECRRGAERLSFVLSVGKLPVRCSTGYYYYDDGILHATPEAAIDAAMQEAGR